MFGMEMSLYILQKRLTRDNAVLSLNILFDFVEWVDYCYGRDYVERVFDEKKIPDATTDMNVGTGRVSAGY